MSHALVFSHARDTYTGMPVYAGHAFWEWPPGTRAVTAVRGAARFPPAPAVAHSGQLGRGTRRVGVAPWQPVTGKDDRGWPSCVRLA